MDVVHAGDVGARGRVASPAVVRGAFAINRKPRMLMRKRLRSGVMLVGVLALAGCAVLAIRSARRTFEGCRPPRRPILAEERAKARATMPALEEVAFRTSD